MWGGAFGNTVKIPNEGASISIDYRIFGGNWIWRESKAILGFRREKSQHMEFMLLTF